MADPLYQSKLIGNALCDFAQQYFVKLLFSLGKCSFFSLALWRPQNSQTFTDPTQFSQTFKALKSASHSSETVKDLQRPCEPCLTTISTFRALATQKSDGKDGEWLQGAHQIQHCLFIQILSSAYKHCAVQVLFLTMWVFQQMWKTTVLCSQLTVQCKAHWSKCCFKWLRIFSR